MVDYVAFCEVCGCPKKLPRHILEHYIGESVCWFYCDNCKRKNVLPEYLKKIVEDL